MGPTPADPTAPCRYGRTRGALGWLVDVAGIRRPAAQAWPRGVGPGPRAKGGGGRGCREVRGTEGKRRRRRREEKLDAAGAAKDSGGSLRFTGESPTRPGILCVAPLVPDDALGSRTALRPSQTPRVPSSTTVHPMRVPLTPYVLAGVAAAGMATEWMRRPSACARRPVRVCARGCGPGRDGSRGEGHLCRKRSSLSSRWQSCRSCRT